MPPLYNPFFSHYRTLSHDVLHSPVVSSKRSCLARRTQSRNTANTLPFFIGSAPLFFLGSAPFVFLVRRPFCLVRLFFLLFIFVPPLCVFLLPFFLAPSLCFYPLPSFSPLPFVFAPSLWFCPPPFGFAPLVLPPPFGFAPSLGFCPSPLVFAPHPLFLPLASFLPLLFVCLPLFFTFFPSHFPPFFSHLFFTPLVSPSFSLFPFFTLFLPCLLPLVPPERAAARICREAGERVATNRFVRDLDIGVPVNDTTLVSVLHCDGSPHRGGADADGVVLVAARRRKERTYLELVQPGHRAKLVVLAGEVAGRWSEETIAFIRHLGKAWARVEPIILRKRAEQGWRMRWCSLLACAAARAFESSLLEQRVPRGVDGETPNVHSVLCDWRFAGFDLAA